MNILEAYIKTHNQIIILILGLPCSNKSEIAKELASDLNLSLVNINDYLKQNTFVEKIASDIKFKLYEHPDNYDWEKLSLDTNNKKKSGIVLYGNYIDSSKLDFEIDFCYFFNMNINLCKNILIEKQMLPYKEDDEKVKIYFKDIFNPIYEKLKQDLKINKFYNLKETTTFEESYDDMFDNLMGQIKKKL
jgi:uridine kinase